MSLESQSSSLADQGSAPATNPSRRSSLLVGSEMWGALAISAMWLAVLFDGIYGTDFHSTTSGGDSTTIPSAAFVALFAFLGTMAVAKRAFGGRRQ